MVQSIKQTVVNSIFGEFYGNKLANLLRDCCAPHISVNFCATCNGIDGNGDPTYNVAASIVYNMSIPGYTALTYYVSTQPLPNAATPFFSTPTAVTPPNVNPALALTSNAAASPNTLA